MRKAMWYFVMLGLPGVAALHVGAQNPALPPGSNFDLSLWYLQLPTSNGVLTGAAGTVDSATTAQLVAGFTNSYFYTGTDGAMVFWAPDDGATTGGSSHPRSELREELSPGDTGVNWNVYGTHTLSAQCKVLKVPADTGETAIAQIHEDGGPNIPLVFIAYQKGKLHADIWTNGEDNSSSVTYQYGNSGLGSNITYLVQVVNGVVTVGINGITNTVNVLQSDPGWATQAIYFKAGDYNQTDDTCNCSTDGAQVAFYMLNHSHAPSITNQPVGVTIPQGNSVSFSVGAIGSGSLSYQWWFNATNRLNGATNSSINLANISPTNSGNYTVVVSDYTGSVTSSIAVLTSIVPAVISKSSLSSNLAAFTLMGSGTSNQPYVLQAATNLARPVSWISLLTNNATFSGALSFTDTHASNYNRRFYRVSTK